MKKIKNGGRDFQKSFPPLALRDYMPFMNSRIKLTTRA